MSKDTDDSLDDVNSLMKMIGGAKKKDVSPKEPEDKPVAPVPPGPDGSTDGAGDFSALMKKLGMANQQAPDLARPHRPAAPRLRHPLLLNRKDRILDFNDLLEEETPQEPLPREPPAEKPDLPGKDVRSSLGKLLANMNTSQQAPASPPEPAPVSPARPPAPARHKRQGAVIEIIDEDPKAALRKLRFAKNTAAEDMPSVARETEIDEKIITVDQISDISGLILPKGATFKIEELKLHGRINAFEGARGSAPPPEFAEIWKKEFSTAGFKDLDMEDEMAQESAKLKPAPKKFGLSTLFEAIHAEEVNYDPRIHGPLVDLVFSAKPGIEEMEMYPVNEPYAYVRIIYDHSTHEYTYQLLEPILTEPEKELLKELKERLFETLDINTKDMSREEARQNSAQPPATSWQTTGSSSTLLPRRSSTTICTRTSSAMVSSTRSCTTNISRIFRATASIRRSLPSTQVTNL